MTKTIIGIFHDRTDAEEAVDELKDRDYNPKDFSIVMKDTDEASEIRDNTGADVVGGATEGAVIGGIAGLVAAAALPGLGAFFIGGPILAALGPSGAVASAASGAVAGGLLGALTGFGISEDEARTYEDHIKRGGIFVAVPARRGQEADVRTVFDEYNADQVKAVNVPEEYESYGTGPLMGAKGGRRKRDEDIIN